MALPKHKTSKSKRDMRRAQKKLVAVAVTQCSQCGEAKLPHHVCPECGVYKGRDVVKTEED